MSKLRLGPRIPEQCTGLTVAQTRIAACLLEGLSNKEIGLAVCLSQRTIECQLAKMRVRMGVASTRGLIVKLATGGR